MAGQTELENPALQRSIAGVLAAVDAEIDGAINRLRRASPRAIPPGQEPEPEARPRSEASARNRLDSLMRRLEDRMRDATDRPDV